MEMRSLEARRYKWGREKAHNFIKATFWKGTELDTCTIDWLAYNDPLNYFVMCQEQNMRVRIVDFESLGRFTIYVEVPNSQEGTYTYWAASVIGAMDCDGGYDLRRSRYCALRETLLMEETGYP